jgi:hypothetical protein
MTLDGNEAHDVLYRALETDLAAVAVYDAALGCATHEELQAEWHRCREAKKRCRRELEGCMRALALDPDVQTDSRHVSRHLGQSLAAAVKMAAQSGAPSMAELVAAECVVHAEVASRHQWSLVARIAQRFPGEAGTALRTLAAKVEEAQDDGVERAEHRRDEIALAAVGLPVSRPDAGGRVDATLAAHASPLAN